MNRRDRLIQAVGAVFILIGVVYILLWRAPLAGIAGSIPLGIGTVLILTRGDGK
jgi:predicted RND superfamily exporter protein